MNYQCDGYLLPIKDLSKQVEGDGRYGLYGHNGLDGRNGHYGLDGLNIGFLNFHLVFGLEMMHIIVHNVH